MYAQLDAVVKRSNPGDPSLFQYFVKVVPTIYENLSGEIIATNQYSVTEHTRVLPPIDHNQIGGRARLHVCVRARAFRVSRDATCAGHEHTLPGVFFLYDLSPIMIRYTERRKSFTHFLTGVCAIVGGVFTVSSLLDSLVYRSLRSLEAKVELGKQT